MSAMLLVLNAGSSSLKFALYPRDVPPLADGHATRPETALLRAEVEGIGHAPRFRVRSGDAASLQVDVSAVTDHAGALDAVLHGLHAGGHMQIAAVGHRVVHGGTRFERPTRIDAESLRALHELVPLAPLHQPYNLAAIERIAQIDPSLPQVACFDTAFHRSQPMLAQQFALPRALTASGIVRYGFHGLSYQYIAGVLAERHGAHLPQRVVVAHLGNGASLCALRDGLSVATSMGFTALDGIPMGTRCGSIDPGVVLHLIRQRGMSVDEVEDLLSRRSGLLGVSGISADMRTLLASDSAHAAEAVDLFAYRINREIGSLAAAMGGLDALVFTAGIGENSAPVRERICRLAAWSGLQLDAEANGAADGCISAAGSAVMAWVVPTDEEVVIARQVRALLG
jgi:acetate kinase